LILSQGKTFPSALILFTVNEKLLLHLQLNVMPCFNPGPLNP